MPWVKLCPSCVLTTEPSNRNWYLTLSAQLLLAAVTVSLTGHFTLTVGVWLAMCGVILKLAASAVPGSARATIIASATGRSRRTLRLVRAAWNVACMGVSPFVA